MNSQNPTKKRRRNHNRIDIGRTRLTLGASLLWVLLWGCQGLQDTGSSPMKNPLTQVEKNSPTVTLTPYRIDQGRIKQALSDKAGDAKAGRDLLVSRISNCTLCHAVIETGERFFGNVGPSLSGVGSRLDAAQLRLHLVNPAYFNPQTIMPSYYRVEGLNKVALEFQGKPVLGAQAIEDVIAYLLTLK